MKLTQFLALAALVGVSAQSINAGEITGKITLKGTPPPEKELPLDANCGKMHTEKPKTRFFVTGAGGELAESSFTSKRVWLVRLLRLPRRPPSWTSTGANILLTFPERWSSRPSPGPRSSAPR